MAARVAQVAFWISTSTFLDASFYYSGRPGFDYSYSTLTSWDGYWFEDRLNGCSGITSAALRGSVDCTAPASLLAARRGSYTY